MIIGNRVFSDNGKTYIMGILNVTPDSFSDGGRWLSADRALEHAGRMLEEGADIIDIGGESTRPGYAMTDTEEEINRIVPVIKRIKQEFDAVISIDTYKSEVAEAALDCGADMVNDIWGLKWDGRMARVISEGGASCCLMHNRRDMKYNNLIEDIKEELSGSIVLAREAGIGTDRIMIDPGVGFAKTYEDNLQVMSSIQSFRELGYPVLLGASRKSVIGITLKLPVEERLEGTLATTSVAVTGGCSFVRVHDIKENRRFIDMLERIKGEGEHG